MPRKFKTYAEYCRHYFPIKREPSPEELGEALAKDWGFAYRRLLKKLPGKKH